MTYYRGSFTYSGTALDHIGHPEGIIRKSSGNYIYYYSKSDHTGSNRLLCHASGGEMVVDQSTDYYPYGLSYENENLNLNRYLYSGKELQDQPINGKMLQLYYFGSRNYDPVLGRWFNIDPALQFTNPSLYCGNSPMMYTDPDGEFVVSLAVVGIAAVIGGGINLAVNWDDIGSFWDGLGYFGIGAAAGAVGGAFVAGAMGVAGTTGVLTFGSGGLAAGSAVSATSYTASTLVLSGGNSLAYGHKFISLKDFGIGLLSTVVTAGVINGVGAIRQGNNFFNGKALSTQQSPVSQVGSTTSKATSIKQTGGNHSVYEGANSATGKTEHVGRSIQPETRYKQHGRSNPATKKLDYKVIQKGLSLTDARILEQQQIIKHGLNNLPFNKINSIAPSKWHLHDQLKHCVPNSKY